MARKVASPKETGGAGYVFEDQVAARWLLCMLQGTSPIDPSLGPPLRLKFQARPDGWLLDDIVGEFGGGVRAAVSVKSTRTVSSCALPAEFTSDCWEQLLPKWGVGFRPGVDLAVLATADVNVEHLRALSDLVQQSVGVKVAEFDNRLQTAKWTNDCVRGFAASFVCPATVAALFAPSAPVHRNEFLGSIRVCSFDFASVVSASTSDALQACKATVASGTDTDAQNLWVALQDLARTERARAGAITLSALVANVGRQVALARHPDHRKAWETVNAGTKLWQDSVRQVIGADARIDREALLDALRERLGQPAPIVIVGESGSGKSAVAAALCDRVLAAGSASIVAFVPDDAAPVVSLAPGVEELFACSSSPLNVLLVDQLEHALDDDGALRVIARLIRAAQASPVEWHIVLVCQASDWAAMRTRLSSQNVVFANPEMIRLDTISLGELQALAAKLPALQWLVERPELLPVMGRPKVLDTLAHLAAEGSAIRPANEPDLIEAIWTLLAAQPSSAAGLEALRTVAELAAKTADERRLRVQLAQLQGGLAALSFAVRFGLVATTGQTLAFGHDLYADYARSRVLLGSFEAADFDSLRRRLTNPRWHAAFRHLSGHLLERSADAAQWHTLLDEMRRSENPGLAADLLLEAVALSPDAASLLQKIRPLILSPEGGLLDRLLWRFFRTCTALDPRVEGLADGLDPAFLDDYRIPSGATWIAFMEFTLANEVAARRLAGPACIRIWRTWLRLDGGTRRLKMADDVAKVALALAEEHVGHLRDGAYASNCSKLYEFILFAASYDVVRAAPPLRYLVGVRTAEDVAARRARVPERPVKVQAPIGFPREGKLRDPWPRGPASRPQSDFARVACSSLGASLLVRANRQLAVELFYALFIEAPRAEESYSYRGGLTEEACGLQHIQTAFPPFHEFPPIAALFAADPMEAVRFVVDVVNFATERNIEARERHGPELDAFRDPELYIDGAARRFAGDERIFLWSRGTWGAPTTNALLMALERWLYDPTTTDGARGDAVRLIFESGRSVALLSVLVDLVLHSPPLLDGVLEPLVTSPLLMLWSRHRASLNDANASLIGWIDAGSERKQSARDWHLMSHRRRDLLRMTAMRYVERSFDWPAVPSAVARWRAAAEGAPHLGDKHWLEVAAAQLDRTYFEVTATEQGTQIVWNPPPTLVARAEEAAAAQSEMVRMLAPFRARQILDGEVQFSVEALEELYGAARATNANDEAEAAAIRCAAAAVALLKGTDWLDADAQRRTDCQKWVLDALAAPPKAQPFDSRGSVGRLHWDDFCVAAFVALWKAERYRADLLSHAVRCLAVPHDSAVRLFFDKMTDEDTQRDSANKFLHAVVQFSRVRHLMNWQQRVGVVDGDFPAVLDRIARDVVSGAIGPLPIEWAEYEAHLPPELVWQKEPPPMVSFGLDDEYVLQAFRWLWRDALVDDRRALVLEHSRQLTKLVTVRIARELARPHGELSHSLPYESDRAAMQLAAALAVTAPDAGVRRLSWEPWLTLPAAAAHWVESFFTYAYDTAASVRSPNALAGIREMLSFVLRDDSFLVSFGSHERGDVAAAVIGAERHASSPGRWTAEQTDLANEVASFLPSWCEAALGWYGSGRALLRFLISPAAAGVRRAALAWLTRGGTKWMREDDLDFLRRFLEVLPIGGSAGQLAVEESTRAEQLLAVLLERKIAGAEVLASRLRGDAK